MIPFLARILCEFWAVATLLASSTPCGVTMLDMPAKLGFFLTALMTSRCELSTLVLTWSGVCELFVLVPPKNWDLFAPMPLNSSKLPWMGSLEVEDETLLSLTTPLEPVMFSFLVVFGKSCFVLAFFCFVRFSWSPSASLSCF